MFEGQSYHTLDPKGRLAVPSRFKDVLKQRGDDGSFVLTNYGGCLRGYSCHDWEALRDKAARTSQFDKNAITFLRAFIAGSSTCQIKNGRITIPVNLRKIIGLEKEVVLVGLLNWFEIWDKDAWERELKRVQEELPEASQYIPNLGL